MAPSEVVLDASFVVDALLGSQPRHDACRAFLDAIAASGSVAYFNVLLVAELWEAAYTIKLRELHGRRWRTHREDGRSLRAAGRARDGLNAAWSAALEALNAVSVDVGEILTEVPAFMRYGLSSSDAIHAATAAYVDVRAFVTLDYHFSLVPPRLLDLYVPQSRVSACRTRRARR